MADETVVQKIYAGLSSATKKIIGTRHVRAILNLATPIRQLIRTYLLRWKAALTAEKNTLVAQTGRFDVVANTIASRRRIVELALQPLEQLSRRVPWQNIAADVPEIAALLQKALAAIPASIPQTGLTQDLIEFLEGVSSYGDLKAKIKELSYEAQRLTAVSGQIRRFNTRIDNDLEIIDAYIELLAAAL